MPLLPLALLLAAEIAQSDVPFSQPQVASNGQVTGIVFGSKNTIYYAPLDAAPVRVADTPVLSLGNHRGPRLAFTAHAIVITAGIGPAGQDFGPNTLRSWRSTDGGKTWSAGPELSTPGTGGMGFQSIASDGKRGLWAAWIGPANGHPTLFLSNSEDEGVTWTKQRVLSETVCECCHPTVAIGADGRIHVLFRNSLDGNRDPYVATSEDRKSFHFVKLGQGSWAINACPMDGGGLAEFHGEVVTLWRRLDQLFLARPDGKAEEAFAAGRNAAVTLREKGLYAIWASPAGIMAQAPGAAPRLLSKTGAFPAIAAAGPVVVAWEEGGKIRTERLD